MAERLTCNVIRKTMHKIALGASGTTYAFYLKVLTQEYFVAEFYRENASFTSKTAN